MTDTMFPPPAPGSAPAWPPPSAFPPPPPPPGAGQGNRKKWIGIGLAVLVGLGVIGALTETKGTSDEEIHRAVNDSVSRSVDANGDLDEETLIRNMCTASLDFRDDGATKTYREMLTDGDVSVNRIAAAFADGYFEDGDGHLMTRGEVVRACIAGLNNY